MMSQSALGDSRHGGATISPLTSAQIKRWMHDGDTALVGPSVDDSSRMAESLWEDVSSGVNIEEALGRFGANTPDVLHALDRQVLERLATNPDTLPSLGLLYEYVARHNQSFNDPDEKQAICARFAYRAWSISRMFASHSETMLWASRCETHVVAQEATSGFLSLPKSQLDDVLIDRFLSARENLVVLVHRQRREANRDPVGSASLGSAVYRWWLARGATGVDPEERAFFAGNLALFVARAVRHLGRLEEATRWASHAETWFTNAVNRECWTVKVDILRAVILYDQHELRKSLAQISAARVQLKHLDLAEESLYARFVEAAIRKALGDLDTSAQLLSSLLDEPELRDDVFMRGLAIADLGEIRGSQGMFREALDLLAAAGPLIEQAEIPWAKAHWHAIHGEVWRDVGKFPEATAAYASAIRLYSDLQMESQAAYLRVLLAETLLLWGKEGEASRELLAALPVFDREALLPAGSAAIALLRESIRRQKADPEALRTLRLELQKMREGNQS